MNARQYFYDLTDKLKKMWCMQCHRDTPHHKSTVRSVIYYVCAECGEVIEVEQGGPNERP